MLTKQGLGNKPCATRLLNNFEVDKLYSSGYFGTTSPLTLQQETQDAQLTFINFSFSHRPIDSLTENSPFFVAMKPQGKITDTIWYSNRALGKIKLANFFQIQHQFWVNQISAVLK